MKNELIKSLEDIELRTTQARLASKIGKKKGAADFLRDEMERIGAMARRAIDGNADNGN